MDDKKISFAQLVTAAQGAITDPPESVEINVTLTGVGAARFNFARTLLVQGFGISEEEAAKVLVQSGAMAHIKRFAEQASPGANDNG